MAYENNPIDSKQKVFRPDERTQEVNTGKTWGPTGETIWRQVVDVGALPNNTNASTTLAISGTLTRVIHMSGYGLNSSTNDCIPLPRPTSATNTSIGVRVNISTKSLILNATGNFSSYSGFVVIEYCKG